MRMRTVLNLLIYFVVSVLYLVCVMAFFRNKENGINLNSLAKTILKMKNLNQ